MKALIQNENGLLINGDSYTTPDTIRIDNTAYSFMNGSNEDIIIGDTNSGYMTALNEDGDIDQSVDLPLQYDLGTDILQNSFAAADANSTAVLTGTGYTVTSTGATGSAVLPRIRFDDCEVGKTYLLSVDTTVNSGAGADIKVYNGDTNVYTDVIEAGTKEYVFTVATGTEPYIAYDGLNSDFDISVVGTLKEVTNTNSYATYYDVDTKAFQTIDNPVGTTYNMTDSFSSYFTTDVPVTEGDRAKLNANANLIYDLWFGSTITGLSFTKANVINFIPATEGIDGGAYLQDLGVDLGDELNSTGNISLVNSDEVTTFTRNGPYACDLAVTTIGTSISNPRLQKALDIPTVIGSIYIVSFNAVVNSGTPTLYQYILGSDTITLNQPVVNGGNTITIQTTTSDNLSRMYFDGRDLFDVSITEWSVKELTAYEIANYTDTCRTFYTDEVYGFQNVLADQDGSGRITGIADLTTVDMIEPLRVRSPDGTVWIITVDDLGVVSAVEEV